MKINDLTVFVITTGQDINYSDCINSINKQSCQFKIDIIRGYAPLSVAFQQMLNRCETKYFIQVDSDMVLHPDAIEILYNLIQTQNDYAMICCRLHDVHYNIDIRGIKIYNSEIFKKFPYNLNHPSCEVEQLQRLESTGYKWLDHPKVIGEHSPQWTSETIFNRYNNLVKKQFLLKGPCGFGNIQQTLAYRLKNKFNDLDFFALLGANSALTEQEFYGEKNFTKHNQNYLLYENQFSEFITKYKQLNILFLYDVDGWVFDFETRNYKKYSSHNIIRKKFDEITNSDFENIDILIIPGSCHYKCLNDRGLISYAQSKKIKIVVQYNSEIELALPRYITKCDLAVASSPNIYKKLKNKQQNLQFIPHFVDTHYWEDSSNNNIFQIGWVGNPECKVKNYDLLKKLNYPIKIQDKCGKQYFIKDRSLDEMKEFYKNIGILLILSESEGSPMPLLEAMASGKVVISTNTGIASLLLPKWCIVDKSKDIIQQVNRILKVFKKYPKQIIKIGKRNLQTVISKNDWFTNVLWIDKIYTDLYNDQLKTITLPIKKIKVVQLARIPCANSGYYLSQLINEYSDIYTSRYILGSEYSMKFPDKVPFRKFPTDLFWQTEKEECIKVIKEADIIHIHHGFWTETKEIQDLIKNKKVITTVYDLSLENNNTYYQRKLNISDLITIADQPAQKRVFSQWSTNYIPLVNCLFDENIEKNNKIPLIVYAPTNRFPITNSSSKGYNEVIKIIKNLKNKGCKFQFDLIEGVSHEEDLNRKRKADIIIDDIINNTWHNTSLYAACFGAIAITGHSSTEYPFIQANLQTLEQTLEYYVNNPSILKYEQQKLSNWRKTNYTPEKLLNVYEKIYKSVLTIKEEKPIFSIPKIIDASDALIEILILGNKENFPICLLLQTCLETMKYGKLINNKPIFLGINLTPKIINILIQNKYKNINNCWIKDNNTINILDYPKKTKPWIYKGIPTNVPLPVIEYLKSLYGENWNKK